MRLLKSKCESHFSDFKAFIDDYNQWDPVTDRETWLVMPMLYDFAKEGIVEQRKLKRQPTKRVNAIVQTIQMLVKREQALYRDLIRTSAPERTVIENAASPPLDFPSDFESKFIALCEDTDLKMQALIGVMKRDIKISFREFKGDIEYELTAEKKKRAYRRSIWMRYFEYEIDMRTTEPQSSLMDKYQAEWKSIDDAEVILAELDLSLKASSLKMLTTIQI